MTWEYIGLVEYVDRTDRVEDRYRYASNITIETNPVLITVKSANTMDASALNSAIDAIVQSLPADYDFSAIVRII